MKASQSADHLSERERMVLNSIVEDFVRNAVPVGSRVLSKKHGVGLSPATIRNVMGDLEEMGYLTHPHTSAGRVPTDKGYRLYVDSLMEVEALSEQEKTEILQHFLRVTKEVDSILDAASQMIARVSSQLGVVLSPRFYQGVFEKIELVPIAEKKVLMVLSIRSGLVRTILLKMDAEVSREIMDKTAAVINERLHGLSLMEIKNTLDSRLRDLVEVDASLVSAIVGSTAPLIDQIELRNFHFGGTNNIMVQPEFSDQRKLSNMLNLLESKQIVIHLFEQNESQGQLTIAIGEENRDELIKYCSLITTSYHIGSVTGTLGVIGPTRMRYPKVIALVDFMAKVLTEVLEESVGGTSSKN
ncbi:heat-inducible transcription repressor HrcA [candidate division KSB1 bacterium]|nr:heat-inducible transcription repressor HrcA [candidate division KSB1 bacterium]